MDGRVNENTILGYNVVRESKDRVEHECLVKVNSYDNWNSQNQYKFLFSTLVIDYNWNTQFIHQNTMYVAVQEGETQSFHDVENIQ